MALFNSVNPSPTDSEQEFLALMSELIEKGLNLEEAANSIFSENRELEDKVLGMLDT
ncbi:hypothetical protein [Thalassotalea atypica]|uniref:hypothetical protein n=1 Tax=Thalassotalea atypica TaxID=2054316 RepID=UPI0025747DB9|nr:hypothetical protein [Thalassotalea atypica]